MRLRMTLGLVVMAAALRLLPHPPNFAPTAALALFGASTLPSRRLALAALFAALLVSDAGLELLYQLGVSSSAGFHAQQWVVYVSFAGVVGIGFLLRGRVSSPAVLLASVAASLVFFIVTNLACWWGSHVYPQDVRGLVLCYESGVPFLWPTLAGDLIYSSALFGTLARAEARFPALRGRRRR